MHDNLITDYSNVKTDVITASIKPITITTVLTEARSLIEKPENWTQGAFARDNLGYSVDLDSADAVCFCTVGALDKAMSNLEFMDKEYYASFYIKDYLNSFISVSLVGFNDSSPHDKVLELFDLAIEASKQPIKTLQF